MEKRSRARLLLLAALAAASPAVAAVSRIHVPQVRAAPSIRAGSTLKLEGSARLFAPTIPSFSPETQKAFQAVSLQLSPDNVGKLSGEQAKTLSAGLFDGILKPSFRAGDGVAGAGSRAFALERSGSSGGGRRARVPAPTGAASRAGDWYHYSRLYFSHLRWYTVSHIKTLWPAYQAKRRAALAAGVVPSVSRPRSFFAHMRVMGAAGPFYVLGFISREDDEVILEARATFREYFTLAEGAERSSFDAFTERARTFNAERRAMSNMSKHLRDALLAASHLPASELSGYFDGLLRADELAGASAYQQGGQAAALEKLRRSVLEAVRAEDPTAADRVVGVILLGSFARSAATPTSDIDLQALTADGASARVPAFQKRLIDAWTTLGLQKAHPVSVHAFAYFPSKRLISRIHYTQYLIIADPALEAALSRRPDEPIPALPPRAMTWKGRAWRAFQFSVVYAATLGR